MRVCRSCSSHNLVSSGFGHAVGNVVGNGAKEQERFLQNQTNLPAVVSHFELLDINAI